MFRLMGSILCMLLFVCCEKEQTNTKTPVDERTFKMGFSSWNYGPELKDITETYSFIQSNGDLYSEQIDHKIPWSAYINNSPLPQTFLDDINFRKTKRTSHHELIVSVSLLNTDRSDLNEDYDGSIPSYSALNDKKIEDAYFQHLKFIVDELSPSYMILAMESNELRIKNQSKWEEYLLLMKQIRSRMKKEYPNLLLSESMTLHNWYNSTDVDYQSEISTYINAHLDFAAISYYPFLINQHSKEAFQKAFDFLHNSIQVPIALVETAHLAEDLNLTSLNFTLSGSPTEQAEYLSVLMQNAQQENYYFVVWWCHRDYDLLWDQFPTDQKELGSIWKDTGLLDGNGEQRVSYQEWESWFKRTYTP